ncbi:MAG: hypothetical protein Q3976_04690 [Corynebacterium sp.]|nr:hypothetical protein [Corynebacterium sp.]
MSARNRAPWIRHIYTPLIVMALCANSITPLPIFQATVANAQEQASVPDSISSVLAQPWSDALGFQPVDALATAAARETFMAEVEDYARTQNTDATAELVHEAQAITDIVAYTQAHEAQLRETVLELSTLGSAGAEKATTQHDFRYDNRDFTGLAISPNATSVYEQADGVVDLLVWVDPSSSDEVYIATRAVGTAESGSDLTPRVSALQPGFNKVRYTMSDRTKPWALYFNNDSTNPAQVRIMAADAAKSASTSSAPSYQPASAAPLVLGSQLHTYPTYTHRGNEEEFAAYLADIRAQAASVAAEKSVIDMTDIRLGLQDFSGSATRTAAAYAEDSPAAAFEKISNAHDIAKERIEFFDHYGGLTHDAAEARDQAADLYRVYVNNHDVGGLFAQDGFYTIGGAGQYQGNLQGTLAPQWNWGMNHEYGHLLDNSPTAVHETTTNIYSLRGGIHLLELQLARGLTPNTEVSALLHSNIASNQEVLVARLNERIAGGDPADNDDQRFTGWGNWSDVIAVYNMFRYWDNFDYSNYDAAAVSSISKGFSPFSTNRLADLDEFGAYGTALRIDREHSAEIGAMLSGLPNGQRQWNRLILIATEATGYDQCTYAESQGFRYITDAVRKICEQYPVAPVPTQYLDMDQDIKTVLNQANPTMQLFPDTYPHTGVTGSGAPLENPKVIAEFQVDGIDPTIHPHTSVSASPTIALQTSTHASAAAVYEIYRGDVLIGYTRTGLDGSTEGTATFVDDNAPAGTVASDYAVIAYDYRLNASGLRALYHLDGGSFPDAGDAESIISPFAKSSFDSNRGYAITTEAPTREGYDFKGWRRIDGLSEEERAADPAYGVIYSAGDVVEGAVAPQLLALWEPKTLTESSTAASTAEESSSEETPESSTYVETSTTAETTGAIPSAVPTSAETSSPEPSTTNSTTVEGTDPATTSASGTTSRRVPVVPSVVITRPASPTVDNSHTPLDSPSLIASTTSTSTLVHEASTAPSATPSASDSSATPESATSDSDSQDKGRSTLARTGADVLLLVAFAALLVVGGIWLLRRNTRK